MCDQDNHAQFYDCLQWCWQFIVYLSSTISNILTLQHTGNDVSILPAI